MKLKHFIPRKFRSSRVKVPPEIIPEEYGQVDYPAIKKVLLAALEKDWGPRCAVKDYDDFPEIRDNMKEHSSTSRCACCVVYEKFDDFWSYFALDDIS